MGAANINRVTITGNLTRDPELRSLPSGTPVASLRVAVNGRRKNPQTGEWEDKPNFFNVSVFGGAGENAHRYLAKGRGVAIDGRLDWRDWIERPPSDEKNQTEKPTGDIRTGTGPERRRESIEIIADTVQYLSDGNGGSSELGGSRPAPYVDPEF